MSELNKVLDEIWRTYEHFKKSQINVRMWDYKISHKITKRKEAEEMEAELNLKRQSIEQIKARLQKPEVTEEK